MTYPFGEKEWQQRIDTYTAWWEHRLDRPLLNIKITGELPDMPEPSVPSHGFASFYDKDISAEQIVERWDYNLACSAYPGDAFPDQWPNFGPGVMAAFLSAELHNGENTVWFAPKEVKELPDISFTYDPENYWLKRIKDIYRAGVNKWQGSVQLGMTDLGGNIDVLSSFRPSERLLLDLYDYPKELMQLTHELHELWLRYFAELNDIIKDTNPGYTAWAPILSKTSYYMLQCDFAYMISPSMFQEYVLPELVETARTFDHAFYHLDGVGQLPHLDALLKCDAIKGIQWIPGAGQPDHDEWADVHEKIRDAGKLDQMYIFGEWDYIEKVFDTAVKNRGDDACGLMLCSTARREDRDNVLRFMERYGAV